ncbi:MAG: hypothetical protein ACLTEH_06205 [Clostridia bacterium]
MKKEIKKQTGITLIALVITIIVLIILASVSIAMLVGENGIITKAKETQELQKIGELTEKLQLEKGSVALDHLGIVLLNDYIEHLKAQQIIEDKDIETLNELQVYITLEDNYVFLVEELDKQDVKITYIGKPGEVPPRITNLEITSTTNSITVKASGLRLEDATYTYYIKTEKGNEYGEAIAVTQQNNYTYANLTQNHIYYICVVAKTPHGTSSMEDSKTTGTIQALTSGNTTFSSTPEGWTNKVVQTKITTTITGFTLQYSKDLVDWKNYTKEVESTKNETIYARLTDGNNMGEYISTKITNIDTDLPKEAQLTLSGAGTVNSNPTVRIKVTHTDDQSGIEIQKSKWVYNTSANAIGLNEASYTGGTFSSNGQELSIPMNTEGTYYLHILTTDKANNQRETISKPVTMVANRHTHLGNASAEGGCYVKTPHTVTKQCNEKVSMNRDNAGWEQWDQGDCMAGPVAGYCSKGHRVTGQVTWGYGTSWTGTTTGTCTQTYTETTYTYDLSCGLAQNQIISYTISY